MFQENVALFLGKFMQIGKAFKAHQLCQRRYKKYTSSGALYVSSFHCHNLAFCGRAADRTCQSFLTRTYSTHYMLCTGLTVRVRGPASWIPWLAQHCFTTWLCRSNNLSARQRRGQFDRMQTHFLPFCLQLCTTDANISVLMLITILCFQRRYRCVTGDNLQLLSQRYIAFICLIHYFFTITK